MMCKSGYSEMITAVDLPASERELLLADPNLVQLTSLIDGLTVAGFAVRATSAASEAMKIIEEAAPTFAIFALRFADFNGLDLLAAAIARRPDARVVIITMYGDIPTAVAAMKLGAVDYKPKPVNVEDVISALLQDIERNDEVDVATDPDNLRSDYIAQLYQTYGGNLAETARRLGMHRRSLQRKLKKRKPET